MFCECFKTWLIYKRLYNVSAISTIAAYYYSIIGIKPSEKLGIQTERLTLPTVRAQYFWVTKREQKKTITNSIKNYQKKEPWAIVIRLDPILLFYFYMYLVLNSRDRVGKNKWGNSECVKLPFSSDTNGVIQMRCCTNQSNMIQW